MTDNGFTKTNRSSNSKLVDILQNCVNFDVYESQEAVEFDFVTKDNCNDLLLHFNKDNKMIANNIFSVSGNISTCSFVSDDSTGDSILEDNGRISLAYENLNTIPRRIAEKFAAHTKVLDLSYNNFHNISFLTFFEELDTLILDRNTNLDVNTLPLLPQLKILWINNCGISNITDWIHRIKLKCPSLEQLSVMGNPGINQNFNTSSLSSRYSMDLMLPPTVITDYRDFILNTLPNLKYLDGISRYSLQCDSLSLKDQGSSSVSFSSGTNFPLTHSCSSSEGNKLRTQSPRISFKNLFVLKKNKISYQSSSTN